MRLWGQQWEESWGFPGKTGPFPPISESYFQVPRVLTWKWWPRGGGDGASREGIFFSHELTSLWPCIVLLNFYSFLSNPSPVIQSIPFVCRSANRTSARHWDYIPSFTFSLCIQVGAFWRAIGQRSIILSSGHVPQRHQPLYPFFFHHPGAPL